MTILHFDFETRSCADLTRVGTDNYARHPTTDIWCLAYAFDNGPTDLWAPSRESHTPAALLAHVAEGGLVYGHNVAFEWSIWNKIMVPRYGWPVLPIEQCRCTMAMAYAMSLPGKLEKAAAALGLDQQKDMAGHRLMLQMCKPRRIDDTGPVWWDDEDRVRRLFAYCRQDVVAERALHHRLQELSDTEQALWVLDHKINERGVPIDTISARKAMDMVEGEKKRLDRQMKRATDGWVTATSNTNQLTDWLRSRGIKTGGVAKADLTALLEGELPEDVRQAIQLRRRAGKSSTAKLTTMLEAAGEDGRVRGTLQYHGASTGRWAGRKIQVQNFPRPNIDQTVIEDAILHIEDPDYLDMFVGNPMDVASWCLRGMICAPEGKEFIAADYSAIEARVLAWLAGEQKILDVFRTHGKIYEAAASDVYRAPLEEVTKAQRQIGKVSVLALGYQGGVGAFQSMARGYGVKIEDDRADRIKIAWREANQNIVQTWYDLDACAKNAVLDPNTVYRAGKIAFAKKGSFLWCQLPSGRRLCYPYPRIVERETPWGALQEGLRYKGVNGLARKWEDIDTYGGKLTENVTQGVARDLLAAALPRLERHDYRTIMHVHDEVLVEVDEGEGSVEEVEALISELPAWAEGLPVTAEGWRGRRFRK